VLDQLPGHRRSGTGSTACCPAHDDQHASLSIAAGDDGRVLLRCHAGCELQAVLSALGVSEADLFPSRAPATRHAPPRVVARYPYTDEAGCVLFEVLRLDPKGFRQRRPRPDGAWDWCLGDVRRVLYRLPRVLAAAQRGEAVFVVEGEKDVHALEDLGLTATTNAGGAGKWRADDAHILRGASGIIVVPDNDDAGRRHAEDVRPARPDTRRPARSRSLLSRLASSGHPRATDRQARRLTPQRPDGILCGSLTPLTKPAPQALVAS
jgi:hypothetical protein